MCQSNVGCCHSPCCGEATLAPRGGTADPLGPAARLQAAQLCAPTPCPAPTSARAGAAQSGPVQPSAAQSGPVQPLLSPNCWQTCWHSSSVLKLLGFPPQPL